MIRTAKVIPLLGALVGLTVLRGASAATRGLEAAYLAGGHA